MAGSLTIPNTFATKTGNVAASLLDDNWDAVADYVNDREIVSGTLGGRPAAGIAGRFYFANNVNGGTLYFDTGSTWVQIAAPVQSTSGFQVTGLSGANNSGTPNTQYDVTAVQVVLWNPTDGGTVVQNNPGTKTNNVSTAGPAAGGRDQAGAFSANSWIHFYFIWNGTTLSTVSSTASQATGPTLPSGYTHWAYIGAVRFDGSSHLRLTRMRGSWMTYETLLSALVGGDATVETAVDISTMIPPNSLQWKGQMWNTGVQADGAGATDALHILRYISGASILQIRSSSTVPASGAAYSLSTGFLMPNQNQNFYYLHAVTNGSLPSMSVDVQGYQVANGDS